MIILFLNLQLTTSTNLSGASDVANIPELYSSTSTILNIDLEALSERAENTYFGYVEKSLKLVGQTSNAQATISDVRLRSDSLGNIIGSFFIPNPNDITTPKFDTGKKVFRLTSNKFNSQIPGNVTCDATDIFEATGTLNTVQSTIISVKNIHSDIITKQESKSVRGETTTSSSSQVLDVRRYNNQSAPEDVDNNGVADNRPDEGWKSQQDVFQGHADVHEGRADAVVDPIAQAYINMRGSDADLDMGAAAYWSTSLANELGSGASAAQITARMEEHIAFADKLEAEPAFEEAWTSANADLISESAADMAEKTGISNWDPPELAAPCGVGHRDPLAQSFWVNGHGIYATKVDLYFGSKDEFLPVSVKL